MARPEASKFEAVLMGAVARVLEALCSFPFSVMPVLLPKTRQGPGPDWVFSRVSCPEHFEYKCLPGVMICCHWVVLMLESHGTGKTSLCKALIIKLSARGSDGYTCW